MAALLLTAEQVYGKHHMHQKETHYRPLAGTAPWHKDQREYAWFKPEHPVDYFVPNFGVDHDIKNTQKHVADAEKSIGHKWEPKLDEEGNFKNLPNNANHGTVGLP